MFKFLSNIAILMLIFSSCGEKQQHKSSEVTKSSNAGKEFAVKLKYSKYFEVENYDGYKILKVKHPFNSTENKIYCIIPRNNNTTKIQHKFDYKIEIPIKSIIPLSSTDIGAILKLGQENFIIGVSNKDYIYSDKIRNNHQLKGVGDSFQLNIEQVVGLNPEIITAPAYEKISAGEQKLIKYGVKMVYIADWQETSILARCEWIKFFALFFDCNQKADSIFNALESRYMHIKDSIQRFAKTTPEVMSGFEYSGIWYQPSGKSYVANLYKDAKAKYFWASDTTGGSLKLSYETVLDKQRNSDVWIMEVAENDKKNIESKKFSIFKAVKTKSVYNNNKKNKGMYANAYWEEATYNPDIILKDLSKMFHPELFKDYELTYFRKVLN